MALANVGVLLANWGYKVLAVDFDLEAPGLENFFSVGLEVEETRQARGMVDLLTEASGAIHNQIRQWEDCTIPVRLPRLSGDLRLLTAGQRSKDYFHRVRDLDFSEFYSSKNGGAAIELFRAELKNRYDFVLLDSRTGFTEVGGVCTVQLPDLIVLLFTATNQALTGGLDIIARASNARQRLPFERPQVPVLPVPSRLDTQAEFRLTQRWLDRFSNDLSELFGDWLPQSVRARTVLELIKLPQMSFFSYGENLPVLEHGTSDPSGLGYAYETVAALIALRLQNVELLSNDRGAYVREASGGAPRLSRESARTNIFLSYSHKDEKWVRRLRTHLAPLMQSRDLVLWDDTRMMPGTEWKEEISERLSRADLVLMIVTPDYLASEFIANTELPAILSAAQQQGVKVAWMAVKETLFQETPISAFQALNDPSKPLSSMRNLDRELVSIAQKISSLAGQSH
jgi:hypothetical protein